MQETTTLSQSSDISSPDIDQGMARSLDMILDIPMQVSVELGRTKMAIKELLQLSQGSIIELNKMAGDHLEVFVNNKLIAKGEVVVVNDRFGVRISEILTPQERVERMG